MAREFQIEVHAVRDLGLQRATDTEIYLAARQQGAIVVTKDQDFVRLLDRYGPPPHVIWVTCGNTSNRRLREVFAVSFAVALRLVGRGEALVEISDAK